MGVVNDFCSYAERLCKPKAVYICDGSEEEFHRIAEAMCEQNEIIRMKRENYLYRSRPDDTARSEDVTFICAQRADDAGPTNNWKDPAYGWQEFEQVVRDEMREKTLYVIPAILGPRHAPYAECGVEFTDSPSVVLTAHKLVRIVHPSLLNEYGPPMLGLHVAGNLDPATRMVLHFPQSRWGRVVLSAHSNFGGNSVLFKKCMGLRLDGPDSWKQGMFAEHTALLEVEHIKTKKIMRIAAAMPSACGKTNLAMLVSCLPDYRVLTLSDDLCRTYAGKDGRLWAIAREQGFFPVAPNSSWRTNPTLMRTIRENSLFINTGITPDGEPWWQGIGSNPPRGLIDWQGNVWDGREDIAQKNARIAVQASRCPAMSPRWEEPSGVPIDAIIFGVRRYDTYPIIFEPYDWEHGIYVGATMRTMTTAAATGPIGALRMDPFAMGPFCGWNMSDYFHYQLELEKRLTKPPKIFQVNWFAKQCLWDGPKENARLLDWIFRRVAGEAKATPTAIGYIPYPEDFDFSGMFDYSGMEISEKMMINRMKTLLHIDAEKWLDECEYQGHFLMQFGKRLPEALWNQHHALERRLKEHNVRINGTHS